VFLSTISGVIADAVDRRRYLVAVQSVQLVGAFVLAGITLTDAPSKWAVFGCVFAIGVANAMGGPGMSAISPSLVPKEDLPGAISLFSFQMNMSRVVGPIIGTALYAAFDRPAIVFVLNGLTYLFAIAGLLVARYPRRAGARIEGSTFDRLASGVRIARADPLIRRVLLILWTMSIFSLNFISFMPEHAQRYLDIHAKSTGYGLLYALFGLGAAGGAMSVGSFLASYDKARLVRPAMAAFAVMLGVFAALRGPALAYPVVFILGYVYFVAITSLSTVLQSNVSDAVRGRVMSLWIMGFGGAVGLAALVWGPVARDHLPQLLLAGAAWGVVLALLSSPERLRANQEVVRA
jgi:MFS family permease